MSESSVHRQTIVSRNALALQMAGEDGGEWRPEGHIIDLACNGSILSTIFVSNEKKMVLATVSLYISCHILPDHLAFLETGKFPATFGFLLS